MNASMLAGLACAGLFLSSAAAQVVAAPFSAPTTITNAFAPFETGATMVLRGRHEGERATTVIAHLGEQRLFDHAGQRVACCVVEEKEFVDGALVEITRHYVAQDDAGDVWAFGEVAVEYEDGALIGAEPDSWIVGGATLATDPQTVHDAPEPQLSMPARLSPGDVIVQDQITGSREVLTVVSVGEPIAVPAGDYVWSVKLSEQGDDDDDGDDVEYRWVVPGVGVVQEQSKQATARLHDSSLFATTGLVREEEDR